MSYFYKIRTIRKSEQNLLHTENPYNSTQKQNNFFTIFRKIVQILGCPGFIRTTKKYPYKNLNPPGNSYNHFNLATLTDLPVYNNKNTNVENDFFWKIVRILGCQDFFRKK